MERTMIPNSAPKSQSLSRSFFDTIFRLYTLLTEKMFLLLMRSTFHFAITSKIA